MSLEIERTENKPMFGTIKSAIFGRADAVERLPTRPLPPRQKLIPETPHKKVFRLVSEGSFEEAGRLAAKLINSGNTDGFLGNPGDVDSANAHGWFRTKISRGLSEPLSVFDDLTRARAAEILRHNETNREVVAHGLIKRMRDVASGRWKLNGETIIISRDGKLNDGQHRCWAVFFIGNAVRTLFAFGIERDTRITVDAGIKRSPGSQLQIKGVASAKGKSALISEYFRLIERRDPTDSEIDLFLESNEQNVDFAFSITNNRMPGRTARSACGAGILYLLNSGVPSEAIGSFMNIVRTKLDHKARCPAFILRDELMTRRRVKREWALATIQHFLFWRSGKTTSKLNIPEYIPPVVA